MWWNRLENDLVIYIIFLHSGIYRENDTHGNKFLLHLHRMRLRVQPCMTTKE